MKRNASLLLNWFFLGSLLVLLFNDHYWKWTYANAITGKLSDIAGLILLPLLLNYCLPKIGRGATIISALFFIFWKSPYSESFLEAYNAITFIPITRVVDYSDLQALLILPLVDYWLRRPDQLARLRPIRMPLVAPLLAAFTILSFSATSPPISYYYSYNHGQGDIRFHATSYKFKMSKQATLDKINSLGLAVEVDTQLIQSFVDQWPYQPDTLAYGEAAYYRIPEMIIGNDTLSDIQFGLQESFSQEKTELHLNALQTTATLDSITLDKKLRRTYKRFLRKNLIRLIR